MNADEGERWKAAAKRQEQTTFRLAALLRDGITLIEMDDEANTPGTDLYTWRSVAREVLDGTQAKRNTSN